MRAGDTITGITGVLDQGPINSTVSSVLPYNWYRLQPTAPICLLYTSDAADDLLCVDLGGRRIIKKKNKKDTNKTYDVDIKTKQQINNNVHSNSPNNILDQ